MNQRLDLFNCVLFTGVVLVSLCAAQPPPSCSEKLVKAGFERYFAHAIAHALHSMTLDDLKLFNPLVNETNGVPVINMDLTVKDPLMPNAPRAEVLPGGTFETRGMQLIDRVLSNMDRKHYDAVGTNTLERVAHAMHMNECWQKALVQYKNLVEQNAPKDICPCLLDIDRNGVTNALRKLSLELIYGNQNHTETGAKHPKYFIMSQPKEYLSGAPPTRVNSPRHGVRNKGKPMPALESTASWTAWKELFLSLNDTKDDYALAYFLYCSLN